MATSRFVPSRTLRLFRWTLAVLGSTALTWGAPVKLDIPSQSALSALPAFSQQAGVQVMFVKDELKDVRTNAVSGELEPSLALTRLLDRTVLTFSEKQPGWYVVKNSKLFESKTGSLDGTVREEKTGRPVVGARVTVLGTNLDAYTDHAGGFSLEELPSGAHVLGISAEGMQNTRVTDVQVAAARRVTLSPITIPAKRPGVVQLEDYIVSAKKNDSVVELDRYDVEGRREKPFTGSNMDLPRTINDTQPYYIFEAGTIDTSGATNIEEFLKQRLTMNTVAQSNAQAVGVNGPNYGNTSAINLRGLGTDKTLVLVNGRRMPGSLTLGGETQGDLNGIPLSAIERIEVLPSSASGIYGGGAMGGVVNVILKQNYSGGEIRATYDSPWDADAPRRSVSATYGMTLEGGRTHLSIRTSWSNTRPLLLKDRVAVLAKNLATIQSTGSSLIYSSLNPWLGALPNVSSVSGGPLVLKNGSVSLNSAMTFVPAGTSTSTSAETLAAGLRTNAGKWNFEFPESTQAPTGLSRPMAVSPKTESIQLTARRQMFPALELFVEASLQKNRTDSIFNALSAAVTIPASSPTNPFTADISVRVPDAGRVPQTTSSKNRSATIGAVAKLPWKWTGAFDYTWSESDFNYKYFVQDNAGRIAAITNGSLNFMVDTLQFPVDLNRYSAATAFAGTNQLQQIAARGAGSLPALPWGTPQVAIGLERRISRTPPAILEQDFPQTVANSSRLKFFERQSTTESGYMELSAPLVKSNWLPGVRTLELQLSGRRERFLVDTGTQYEQVLYRRTPPVTSYSAPTLNGLPYFSETTYASNNVTSGIRYQPVKGITLRVSRANAFLPPTADQLIRNPVPSTTTINVLDPVTGRQTPVFTLGGGNPDLKPQNSKSRNMGLIWEPTWRLFRGVRLNAEYYKIEQFDAIATLGAQSIVDQESVYRNRVTRDVSGKITQVDASSVNLYGRRTQGWDLSFDYTVQTPLGRFSLHAVQSTIEYLKSQYSQVLPMYDAVDFPSEGGAVRRKNNATLAWEWRRWNVGWSTQYASSYKQNGAAGGPGATQRRATNPNAALSTAYTLPQGGDSIPSQIYHDVNVGYTFGKTEITGPSFPRRASSFLLSGVSVQLGVRNLANTVPPFDVFYSSNYFESPFGDLRLRSYWLSVRKQF